ncbi:type II toxin-antitoxin system RelE/ParE family toxin [Azohydromonas aeria]|uniref:type II toxin-antitoxin system RelE/ParE family toxin n=1 Tax=Azohydromonas aeria TaxID=2590212 RepID=UPI0012F9E000|nr:type II toxin-antitoxin system RelE/ParE family toxin [Azohydromonas aeria]
MKRCLLRPRARDDRRAEVLNYREVAGTAVAARLVTAMAKALEELSTNPGMGSPVLGQTLGVEGLRTWRLDGFPLTFWYFERDEHVDVVRLVGQRQDPGRLMDFDD